MIRVALPHHLRTLAGVGTEVTLEVSTPVTMGRTLDALEAAHPVLRGTIRERATGRRRAFVRLFADGGDLSDAPPDTLLPATVRAGRAPLRVVGAIAGG